MPTEPKKSGDNLDDGDESQIALDQQIAAVEAAMHAEIAANCETERAATLRAAAETLRELLRQQDADNLQAARLTKRMREEIINIGNGLDPGRGVYGRSAWGGLSNTIRALHSRRLLTVNGPGVRGGELNEKGRSVFRAILLTPPQGGE